MLSVDQQLTMREGMRERKSEGEKPSKGRESRQVELPQKKGHKLLLASKFHLSKTDSRD